MLMSSFWALHRDENVWQDAEAFLPERWLDSSPKAVEQRNASWKAFGACCGSSAHARPGAPAASVSSMGCDSWICTC